MFGLFGNKEETKEESKGFLVLVCVHNISGRIVKFWLDLNEFETSLEEERQNLDELLENSRNLIQEAKIADRDLLGDFGHSRIRVMDFSGFSIEFKKTHS